MCTKPQVPCAPNSKPGTGSGEARSKGEEVDRKETASKSTALTVETLGEDSSGGRNLTAPLQPGQHEGHEQGAPGGKPLVATPTPLAS